ncbi:uncharacterized protein LOC132182321 isoform X2 [Corylus avellana]|uniref:uncharacterized protein LOC132182321 isoform X2 n=1 Tax=Corylus avellana TaxID=13451 RepID=UPI00286AF16E|nr:uncharacterized protein LOC132182321 isoform X2 [Corylus avellana]
MLRPARWIPWWRWKYMFFIIFSARREIDVLADDEGRAGKLKILCWIISMTTAAALFYLKEVESVLCVQHQHLLEKLLVPRSWLLLQLRRQQCFDFL